VPVVCCVNSFILFTNYFLQVVFCYCCYILAAQLIRGVCHLVDISFSYCFIRILQPALIECALVSNFHFIIKRLSFFNYHRPSHRFSFTMHYCKQLYFTLSICAKLGSCSVCHFKSSFTLLCDVMNDCIWSLCFFLPTINT